MLSSSRPLKLWHVAELYPPDYGGGAAVYIRDVCRFLAERGHDVRVWCTENRDTPAYGVRLDNDGPVKLYRINLPHFRQKDPGGWLLGIRGWQEHTRKIKLICQEFLSNWTPDLVHFHTAHCLVEECLDVILDRTIPIIGMAHDAWLICPRLRLVRSPTDQPCAGPGPLRCLECLYSHWDRTHIRAALKMPWRLLKLGLYPAYRLRKRTQLRRHVEGLIGYSKYMAVVHRGTIPGLVEHISLGVDMSGKPVTRPARPRNPVRFGFAGGIQVHKGIFDVLDAAKVLKRRGLAFELQVWGPNQDRAIPEIASRGLQDRVILNGMFEPEQRWAAFGEFDVLLMATRDNEPYGRVIQEAAASGVPSIAPNIAGIGEQIRDGVDGLLFRFRDSQDLERQMARVVEESGLVARLAANLWDVVDTREAVGEIEEFYHNVLGRRSGRVSLRLTDEVGSTADMDGET